MKSNHYKPPPCEALAHVHGFDRIAVATDRTTLVEPIDGLDFTCAGGAELTVRSLKYNPTWKAVLELFQPSPKAIEILQNDCLSDKIGAMVTYVEVAWDIIFKTRAQAREYQAWLLERISMRHQRDPVRVVKRTVYFSRRTTATSGKRGVVGVAYADRASKLSSPHFGRPCVHVEVRVTGSAAAASAGIACVSDLPRFDHAGFWMRAVRFQERPGPTTLGRLLGERREHPVSGSALRKRAKRFIEECSIDGQFFMHNALRGNRAVTKRFAQIPLGHVMPIASDAD